MFYSFLLISMLIGCQQDCMVLGGGYGHAHVPLIRQECEDNGGINCSSDFIEKEAAICIVDHDRDDLNLNKLNCGIYTTLMYSSIFHKVIWNVSYCITNKGQTYFSVDAVDGTILDDEVDEIGF